MAEYSPLEAILRLCAAAAPVPWYPRRAAADLGLTDADLAAFIDQLRRGGLIARTDDVPGYGRGYVLTPLGLHALQNAGGLEWLRRGEVPPRPAATAEGAPAEGAAVPERERAVRMSLLAPFTPYVVRGLIAANVAVFLWGVYLGHRQGIKPEHFLYVSPPHIAYETGAIKADDLMAPGWGLARLLTCCFVHFGLIHLGANMISLYLIGPLLERMWGHIRFLVLYLIAGFGGSCAAMVLRPTTSQGDLVTLAGASGAVWGLLAALAVWVLLNRRHMPRRLFSSWGRQIVIAFAINIALTYQMSRYLSSEAHYGGGIVGAVCAVLLHLTRFGPAALRGLAAAAVAALPVLGLWAVTHPGRFNPEWDRLEWHERYLPPVRRADEEARDVLRRSPADLLLRQEPTARDEERRQEVLAKYDTAIDTLRAALDLLRDTGPFHDPKTEEARQAGLALVEARLDLWAWEERALKDKEDLPAKDKKYRDVRDRVTKLEEQWRQAQALR